MTEHDDTMHPGCREVLAQLYDYLDGELDATSSEQVRAHLDVCRPCLSRFEFERLFHEYVQARVPRPKAREAFKAGLLARIRAESREGLSGNGGSAVRLMPRFALAASIMLLIAVGSWWMNTPHAADWKRLADYHYHRTEIPGDGIETNCPFKSRDFIISRLGEETGRVIPTVVPAGMTVHEACVKPLSSGRVAFLEWRAQRGDVSVVVARATCLPLGGTASMEWQGRPYHVVSHDGLNAICWEEDGGYVCVMMAPDDFSTMFTWVEEMRGPGSF